MKLTSDKKGFLTDALHIFILFSIAITRPLLEVLARDPEFFVIRRSQPFDIILLVLILSFLLPSFIVLFEYLCGLLSQRLRKAVHGFAVAILVSFIFIIFVKWIGLSGLTGFILGSASGIVTAILYARKKEVRLFCTYLFPAPLFIAILFLTNASVFKLLSSEEGSIPLVKVIATTPVVLLILDEIPVTSLMNDQLEIDAIRYPNFDRFARQSTWYLNATTVSDRTNDSVPAILTGNYPDVSLLPTVLDYPRNLFTLLGGSYKMVIFESGTKLRPERLGIGEKEKENTKERIGSMLLDLSAVYLQILLPPVLSQNFPSVAQTWRDFWQEGKEKNNRENYKDRGDKFRTFVDSIHATEGPVLYFLHTILPHGPWQYFPSGSGYNYARLAPLTYEDRGDTWSGDEATITRAFQRHLLQVGYVDKMLGEVMDSFKASALFDRSLIIVVGDHGICFRHGEERRIITKSNYQDIMAVPLFIKRPFQNAGYVSDENVQTIDILPTVARVLGIVLPWHVEGQSIQGEETSEPKNKIIISSMNGSGQRMEFEPDMNIRSGNLSRMLDLFGSGDSFDSLFLYGPYPEIIGKEIKDLQTSAENAVIVEMNNAKLFEKVDSKMQFVPALVTGRLFFQDPAPENYVMGIAVNGTIRATTRTFPVDGSTHGFAVMVPEIAFRPGRNEVSFISIDPDSHLFKLIKSGSR